MSFTLPLRENRLASAVPLNCASCTMISFLFFEFWVCFLTLKHEIKLAMTRSINLAKSNCLENKYINIYIRKIYICFEGNCYQKLNAVSILIDDW
jgi:hypothetical protein